VVVRPSPRLFFRKFAKSSLAARELLVAEQLPLFQLGCFSRHRMLGFMYCSPPHEKSHDIRHPRVAAFRFPFSDHGGRSEQKRKKKKERKDVKQLMIGFILGVV
jgi:hypothetical protein